MRAALGWSDTRTGDPPMSRKSAHHVTLSNSTFHALHLVVRLDRVSLDWIAEAIHEAHHETKRASGMEDK